MPAYLRGGCKLKVRPLESHLIEPLLSALRQQSRSGENNKDVPRLVLFAPRSVTCLKQRLRKNSLAGTHAADDAETNITAAVQLLTNGGLYPMDPITALAAISSALGIVDKVANQFERFYHKAPETGHDQPHNVTVEKRDDTLEVKREGHVIDTITAADLERLDDNSRRLIKTLEDSMQRSYDLWVAIYPQRDSSPDPMRNAQVDAQLKDVAKKMCGDLEKIFRYLNSIGKHLDDHYRDIRFVCSEIQTNQPR